MDEFRQKGGKKAVRIAIIANSILTVLNIVVGVISGSYALVSEGAHTLSDVTTSIIAYIGFYIGQKPADSEHPIGHGRAEAISGLIIVIFLVIVAWEIMQGALEKTEQSVPIPANRLRRYGKRSKVGAPIAFHVSYRHSGNQDIQCNNSNRNRHEKRHGQRQNSRSETA